MYIARSRCVDSVRLTEALLSIDGVLPPVDVVCLGIGPTYTLLVVNRAEVVVKHMIKTNVYLIFGDLRA